VGNKLQKVDGGTVSGSSAEAVEENATLIRRISVIFSSVAPPISLDYIVTVDGISTLPDVSFSREVQKVPLVPQPTATLIAGTFDPEALSQVSPLDVGCAEDEVVKGSVEQTLQVDEWDAYWEQDEGDAYNNVDLDALLAESNL
jgi:DNA repair protein RAD57